jgi:hypothetical protein
MSLPLLGTYTLPLSSHRMERVTLHCEHDPAVAAVHETATLRPIQVLPINLTSPPMRSVLQVGAVAETSGPKVAWAILRQFTTCPMAKVPLPGAHRSPSGAQYRFRNNSDGAPLPPPEGAPLDPREKLGQTAAPQQSNLNPLSAVLRFSC